MIDVTLLGTAATMPLPDRALTSAYLAYNGRSILFDCGEGTQTAARKAHVSLMKTDLIALTHYHGDHIFGLPGLLQTMGCMGRTAPLYITGPEGLGDALRPILALSGLLPFPVYALTVQEHSAIDRGRESGLIRLSDVIPGWPVEASLSFFETDHRVKSCGYRFNLTRPGRFNVDNAVALGVPQNMWGILQHGEAVSLDNGKVIEPSDVLGSERRGLSVVISGDTAPCRSLEEASAGADLLVCDATYGDDELSAQAGKYGHSTFADAASLAKKAGVKLLWLTHFSQMMENPADYLRNATDIFPNAVCTEDGINIHLVFD